MVRINGGTFMMGSPEDESGRIDREEGPQHQVTVSSFYMGRYEVTQAEYKAVMGTNPPELEFRGSNLPVENVKWYDAIVFCNKLSMREGLSPAYSINGSTNPAVWGTSRGRSAIWNTVVIVENSTGYRLPTEAQWEYACRAGTTTPFSTGDNITTAQANYNGNFPYNNNPNGIHRKRTTEVGSFAPNAWGLYDMHGNVAEWCWDWYGRYVSVAQTAPHGESFGSYRVARGGFWNYHCKDVRSASRGNYSPNYRFANIGFRIVRP